MKKLNKIFIWLPVIIIQLTSCNDTLDLEPVSTISATAFWQTEDDAQGGLYGMYDRFRDVTNRNLFLWGEARSQSMQQSIGNDYTNVRIFQNTLDAIDAGPSWETLYKVINDANLIIKHVPDIEFSNQLDKNQILAEAYSMRAFCYFVITKTWGDAVIFTEPTEGYFPEELYKERSPVIDVFTLIKEDIEEALSFYENNDFTTGRNRWSKPAVNALKGDVYLWTAKVMNGGEPDFIIALDALNEIESSDVSLLSDFSSIFDYDNKGNKEILFSSNNQQFESESTFMANMYIDAIPPDAEPEAADILGVPAGASYWTLTDESISKFLEEDQRKDATFVELYTLNEESGEYTDFYGCLQVKFNGLVENGARYFLDDVVIYRYADVLLMKAEAQNALGQDPSTPMNEIRMRAFGDNYDDHVFVNGTQEENDSVILNERLIEFFYEGKYWWDIVRFNKTSELVPYFRDNPGDDYKLLWPIGLDILSLEPNVEQNPGYN
ncbi:RagB/SusD family nutrient uptake outer membrane protein [Maribacter sp. MMG018]|uniref:RagB/SusD family nutrient uptake outer membrane protein n=1 Tax=Maribacter sp. MMG018 TaxID=2822688 RepID=UPI001B392539|nr:RagB/SusD family nutrient uptake outer membrane protein [Maribacter sp. MMG018]MBQ4915823.1 RagB/SusD family nutrient uptake outer membrane protein [Maribacter sp. MMG018]